MAKIKLKIHVDPVEVLVDKEDYKDEWQEHCEEEGDVEEGEDAGEPSDEFVMEQYQEDVEAGNIDISDELAMATIRVEKA